MNFTHNNSLAEALSWGFFFKHKSKNAIKSFDHFCGSLRVGAGSFGIWNIT